MKNPGLYLFCFSILMSFTAAPLVLAAQAPGSKTPSPVYDLFELTQYAKTHARSYQLLEARSQLSRSPELEAAAALDTQIQMEWMESDDQSEQATDLRPKRMQNSGGKLKISRYMTTGTAVSLEVESARRLNQFDPAITQSINVIDEPYYESLGRLSIKQRLWRDAFGSATRKQLEASQLLGESKEAEVEAQKEKWFLDLAKLYDSVWLAQHSLNSDLESLARSRRLLGITKLKSKRGTAESPEVLEVESAVILGEQKVIESRYLWFKLWSQLRQYTGLTDTIDESAAGKLQLKVAQPEKAAHTFCAQENAQDLQQNKIQKQLSAQLSASQLGYEAAKSQMHPDLSFVASVGSNGIDLAGRNYATKEVFQNENPVWFAGLVLEWSWESHAAQAQAMKASSQNQQAKIAQQQHASDLSESWKLHCGRLRTLTEKIKALTEVTQKQGAKVKAEDNRFQIGRGAAYQLLRAGDDFAKSQMALHMVEAELRETAWMIQHMNGEVTARVILSENIVGNDPNSTPKLSQNSKVRKK